MLRCEHVERRENVEEKVGRRYIKGDMRECGFNGEMVRDRWRAKIR